MRLIALGTCVSLVALVAMSCSGDRTGEVTTSESEAPPDEGGAPGTVTPPDGVDPLATEPDPLAVFEDATGSVAWYPPDQAGDELSVVITLRGTAAPILHPDFVQKVGAIRAYMALTERGAPVPESLLPYVTDRDRAALADAAALDALRDDARQIREEITAMNAREIAGADLEPNLDALSSGCTAGQKTAAKNAYGAAYSSGGGNSGTKTCGESLPFHNASGTVYYCNFDECDQDYTLALGQCGTVVDDDCTTVGGTTTARRARMQTSPGANPTFQNFGLRYAFAYYNCSDTLDAVMRHKRGNGSWVFTQIEPGAMMIRVGGGAIPAPYAIAHTVGLGGTVWHEERDWTDDGPQSPLNVQNMVAATNGLLCGDIIQRFATFDASAGSCNGGNRLCEETPCHGTGLCYE